MLDQTFNYNGSSIAFSVNGSGPTVLFLHGFGEDHTYWASAGQQLEQYYRVILMDTPGTGMAVLGAALHSIETLADSVAALVEYLAIDRLCIIGHSMGGYIALAFAAKYGSKLSGLGLMHSTAYPDSEEKKQTRRKSMEFIQKNGSLAFFKQSVPNLFAPLFQQNNPGILKSYIETAAAIPENSVLRYTQMMLERPGHIEALKTIQVPVLFIIGRLDQAVPYKESLAQCYLSPLSHVDILPSAAHMGMVEKNDHTTNTLGSFLEITVLYSKHIAQ